MTRLFQRAIVVQVDRLRLVDLDVAFQIERTLRREPNRAELSIFNLSRNHRAQLEQLAEVYVSIEAGYGTTTSRIFYGFMRNAVSSRDGASIVTKLSAGDGENAMRRSRVARSYSAGTGVGAVLRDVGSAIGVDLGNLAELTRGTILEGAGSVFADGTVVSGSAADEFDRLAHSAGLEWSIQDERLQVLRRGEALAGTAVRLSSSTGLVGTPSIDSKGVLSAQTLLIPDVFPGRKVLLESEFIRGVFRVERATYQGATRGGDWLIDLECKAV